MLVHERDWVERLRAGTLTYADIMRLEIPYSRRMVEAFWLAAGGTLLAARHALRDGAAYNVTVDTGDIQLREEYSPSQAVPYTF